MNKRRGNAAAAIKRLAAGLLSLMLVSSLFTVMTPEAKAESTWMDPYLNTLVDWNVMRGDSSGNLNPYRQITRAEFVTMVNRAFGYSEVGSIPFTDVPSDAWYAEDIAIAYNAGYFNGTTATTASPYALITREQAAVLLARNLRLQSGTGDILDFSDSRSMGSWSRGLVSEAARLGIITGYEDGTFRPKQYITRGQVAVFLVRALGTLIQEPGTYDNRDIYGHLTINTAGVTLKDTVVTGNLYLTGGIGLGDITLENVTVEGKIIVGGAGESNAGDSSIVLRNVTADDLVVDSLSDQFLSLRSEGLTTIDNTEVRTSAYIEDLTGSGRGLKNIEFNANSGAELQLAGNIKDVINLTPASKLNMAQGVANTVTVDEKAVGSTLNVDGTAYIKTTNLDVGTTVTGTGDMDHLNVNANGSTVSVLPDTITVRPGISANISSETMDSAAAAESSETPRILAGYPKARDVAASSAELVFSTNKKGTLYWAVTGLADGSVEESELVKPSSAKIVKSGSLAVSASKTEVTAKVSGLTSGGSYYVSAVLEDNRGMRSPVKVTAFTTPDNTVPAFSTGYPTTVMTEDEDGEIILQAQVMANKDCRLYYALLTKGSSAPTAADFKSAAISGSLGYGSEDLRKNAPALISQINTSGLKEETTYDLYLWLTDADGAKSSAVKKLTVTTPDKTPPSIQYLRTKDITAKSVTMSFALDEPGTLYWAVVKQGATFFDETIDPSSLEGLNDKNAKMQIETALSALKKGSSNAAKGTTDYTFTISGLEAQTIYDLYFVAKDKSGNYNVYSVALQPPMQINTEDNIPPTVTQEFTKMDGTDKKPIPYPDTTINLVFSENVQGVTYEGGKRYTHEFLELYNDAVTAGNYDELAEALERHIQLWYYPAEGGAAEQVKARTSAGDTSTDWVLDYTKATVMLDPAGSGELTISFPYSAAENKSATRLGGGTTYYFELHDITDTSNNMNSMVGSTKGYKLPEFTIISAQVLLNEGVKTSTTNQNFHMTFTVTPISNENMAENIFYDLIFWSDTRVEFDLYKMGDSWTEIGTGTINSDGSQRLGVNETYITATKKNIEPKENLTQLRAVRSGEYGIQITKINGNSKTEDWNVPVTIGVTAVSGKSGPVEQITNKLVNSATYDTLLSEKSGLMDISVPASFSMEYTFMDSTPPEFKQISFEPGDTGVTINLSLNRLNSHYYYVVAPKGQVDTTLDLDNNSVISGATTTEALQTTRDPDTGKVIKLGLVPDGYIWSVDERDDKFKFVYATEPTNGTVMTLKSTNNAIKVGKGDYDGTLVSFGLEDLQPTTDYIAYFVLQGEAQNSASQVYCFYFRTDKVSRPIITTTVTAPSVQVTVDKTSKVDYILAKTSDLGVPFTTVFGENNTAGAGWDEYKKAHNIKEGYTVLDAMAGNVTDDNQKYIGSVFDHYASADLKDRVAGLIQQQNEGYGIVETGRDKEYPANKTQTVKSDNMQGKSYYTLLIVAEATVGSEYAFRAARPVHNVGGEAPKVSQCTFAGETDSTGGTVSGKLMVQFDGPLYYRAQIGTDEKVTPLDGCQSDGKHGTSSSYDFAKKYITLGSGISYVAGTHEVAVQTLRFKVDFARAGAGITFDVNICDANGNVHEKNPLSLTLKNTKNKDGTIAEWYFEVSPSVWDAT